MAIGDQADQASNSFKAVNMALAEVSGLSSLINCNNAAKDDEFRQDLEYANFTNNTALAMPPFSNVSSIFIH